MLPRGWIESQASTKAARSLGYPTGSGWLGRSTTAIVPVSWVELFLASDSLRGKSLKRRCSQASARGVHYHKLAGGKTSCDGTEQELSPISIFPSKLLVQLFPFLPPHFHLPD